MSLAPQYSHINSELHNTLVGAGWSYHPYNNLTYKRGEDIIVNTDDTYIHWTYNGEAYTDSELVSLFGGDASPYNFGENSI